MNNLTIFCSDERHPIWGLMSHFVSVKMYSDASCRLESKIDGLKGGDILVMVSCTQIINKEIRDKYKKVFVIHESDLPRGRGWSPLAWQVLEGKNKITVTLFEADDTVDSGPIYGQKILALEGHELNDEITRKVGQIKCELINHAWEWGLKDEPIKQQGEATYYHRRTPEHSRIDPEMPLSRQFDLLRICEPRFPAFFDYRGHRYAISLRKV